MKIHKDTMQSSLKISTGWPWNIRGPLFVKCGLSKLWISSKTPITLQIDGGMPMNTVSIAAINSRFIAMSSDQNQ